MVRVGDEDWEFESEFGERRAHHDAKARMDAAKREAAELRKLARRDPLAAAEGAVRLLERLGAVPSDTDGIRKGVERVVRILAPIVANAPVDVDGRDRLLRRLSPMLETEGVCGELLAAAWGDLCGSPEIASAWADELLRPALKALDGDDHDDDPLGDVLNACFSALYRAERFGEILALLSMSGDVFRQAHTWGAKALLGMGRPDDAIRFAHLCLESGRGDRELENLCEEALSSAGRSEELYQRFVGQVSRGRTGVHALRAVRAKFPDKTDREIIRDLMKATPGREGRWFAALKDAGMLDEALRVARQGPCEPRTLTRAAHDFAETNPTFAAEVGFLAIRWLVAGHGYQPMAEDVRDAYGATLRAATTAGIAEETIRRIREVVSEETVGQRFPGRRFVTEILGPDLGLAQRPTS